MLWWEMTVLAILNKKGAEVATARAEDTLLDIVKALEDKGIGALVISNEPGKIDGIVSERDVVRAIAAKGAGVLSDPVSKHMTAKVVTCSADERVADLMAKMTAGRFRHLPVAEDGKLVGIVSIGDVVKQRIAEAEGEAEAMRSYIATG